MEKEFFDLIDRTERVSVNFGYSSVTDWSIQVYDLKGKPLGDWGEPFICIQDCDRTYVLAKAYSELVDHLLDTRGST